jgi:hypothetical protein
MSNGTFDFNAFIQESIETLINPKSYFSSMKTSGGMTEPLIKAIIYGVIAGAIAFIWSILKLGAMGGIVSGGIGIMIFFRYIIISIIGLYIGAIILMIISSICKGSTDFEANARVVAALMVMMPVTALLGIASHLNLYLRFLGGIALNVYSIWLLYNALIEALKSKPETTKILMYILIAIIVLISLIVLVIKLTLMKEFISSDFGKMM